MYIRKGYKSKEAVLVVCNYTPVPRENYRVGAPAELYKAGGKLREVFNSNAKKYGGSGDYIAESVAVEAVPWNNRENSIKIDLAPLAVMVFAL